ncbi:MAG: HPr family phosphocarrier protein [Clostridia bacterium]|nr:HPr family phosphocarrier protein [Clostridia bacterium]
MKEFRHIIKDKNGLHARPAGMLATLARSFESDIKVEAGGKAADGKRLLSLMSLGARYETELKFTISGSDEELALRALTEHCRTKLNGE